MAPIRPVPVSRQVRISDDVADRLAEQGGSLSAAAERTLVWALDVIDGIDDDPEPVDNLPSEDVEPVDSQPSPRAGARRGSRISGRSTANARLFAAATRHSW